MHCSTVYAEKRRASRVALIRTRLSAGTWAVGRVVLGTDGAAGSGSGSAAPRTFTGLSLSDTSLTSDW